MNLKRLACAFFALVLILGMCPAIQVFSLPVDEDGEIMNLTGEYVEDEKDYKKYTYQTTGDALVGESVNYDTAAGVDAYLDLLEEVGISRVYWRGIQQCIMSEANGREQNPWICLHETIMGAVMDPNKGDFGGLNMEQYLVQEAHKRGIEIVAVMSLWDWNHLGDVVLGAGVGFKWWDELGTKALVDQYGLMKRSGADYSDPEYRAFIVSKLMQWMKTNDYDGIQFLTYSENYQLRFDDQFGYSDYAINDFINNIYKRNGTWVTPGYGNWSNYGTLLDWQMHRGSYITQFFRELRAELDGWKEGCKMGIFMDPRNMRHSQHWYAVSMLQPSDSSYFDYETWFQEGLVTEIIVYGANDVQLQKKAIEDLMWMARGTDVRIGPYTSYPWNNTTWDEYYKQGGFTCCYWWRPFEIYGAFQRYDESWYDAQGEDAAEKYWLRKAYLGSVDVTMEELLPYLEREDSNYYALTAATIIVQKYPDEAAPILEKLLTHTDPGVRARALMLINGQFSNNKKFFTENTFDQIIHAVTMDGDYSSCVMFDVGADVLQALSKEDETVNTKLWEIFRDDSNSLYLRTFACHALNESFIKVSNLTVTEAHAMITGDGEFAYDRTKYNAKDLDERLETRMKTYIAYFLAQVVARGAYNGDAKAMEYVESYIETENSALMHFTLEWLYLRAASFSGDRLTWVLQQMENAFLKMSDSVETNFVDDYKTYGDFYLARWIDKFGAPGRAILEKYYYGDDAKLAVAAWEQMYLPQGESGFNFMTEEEYAEVYTKLPEAMLSYDKTIISQNFEDYSQFTPALQTLAGSYSKDSGRWGAYDRKNSFITTDNSRSGRQSTLFQGNMGGFYSATDRRVADGIGYKLSMWIYHDGGAKFYASVGVNGTGYGGNETGFMVSEDGSVYLPDVDYVGTSTDPQVKVRERYVIDTGLDVPLNTWTQVNLVVNRSENNTNASAYLSDEVGTITKMSIDPVKVYSKGSLGMVYYDHVGNAGNSKTFVDDMEWMEKSINTAAIRPETIIFEDGVAIYDGQPKELKIVSDPAANITNVQYVYYDEDGEIMYDQLPVEAGIYTVRATILDGGDYQGESFTAQLEIRAVATMMEGELAVEISKAGSVLKDTKFVTTGVKVVETATGKEVKGSFQWENPGTWLTGSSTHNYVFVPDNPNYKQVRGSIYVPVTADKYTTGTVLQQDFENTSVFVPGKAGTAAASGAGGTWAGLADSMANGSVITTGTYTKPVIIPPQNQAIRLERGAGETIGRVSLRGTEMAADTEYEITYRLFWQGAFTMYVGYGQDPTRGDSVLKFDADGYLYTFDNAGAIVKSSTNKIPKNAWSTVKLTTNRAAGTYTVTITPDEGQAITVNGVLKNNIIYHLYFRGEANNTKLGFLDDFQMDRIVGGQRETVYKQDFNDTTYFSSSKYIKESVALKTGAGGRWDIETRDNTKILVAELVSNIGLAQPNYQQLMLVRKSGLADGQTNVVFGEKIAATEDYEISFRMSWQSNMSIYLGYSAETTSDSYITIKDGYLHVHDSATGTARKDTAGQIPAGIWSTVKVVSNRATGKYTVTVTPDGGTAFTVTGDLVGKELSRIYFSGHSNNTTLAYVDDVKVVKKTAGGTSTILDQDFENTDLFDSNEVLTAKKELNVGGTGGKWTVDIRGTSTHKWIHSTAPTEDGAEEEEEEEEEVTPAPAEKKDVVSGGKQSLKLVRLDGNKGHVTVTLPNTVKATQDYTFSCRIYQPESRRFGIFFGEGANSTTAGDAAFWLPQEDGEITIFDATDYTTKSTGYTLKTGEWATLTITTNRMMGTYTATLQHDTDLEPIVLGTAKLGNKDVSKIFFSCGYVAPEQTPCVMAYIDDVKMTRTYPSTSGLVRPSYKINLAEGLSGASSVTLNSTCYFTVDNWSPNYTYDFEVWMGDRDYLKEDEEDDTALYFQDKKNGTYSIYNVTDEVKVTFTKRAKTYKVSAVGEAGTSVLGASRATYGQDYTFKINENPAYDYLVKILVRGLLYEPERDGNTYTIAGEDVTGPITVQVNVTPCVDHTGGHAACGEKARCERCNAEYGRIGSHDLTKTEAKAPSYNEEGNIEYYTCNECGKYFSDERAKIELKRRDLKITQLITYNKEEAKISRGAMDLAITEAGSAVNVKIVATNEETPVTKFSIPQIPLMNVAKVGKTLTVVTDKVSVTMDQKLMSLVSQGEGGMTFEINEIDLDSLNDAQKSAMAEYAVWQAIDATLISGGENIHDFGGGKATLKVSFTPEEGVSAREYQLWYIAEDGTIEKMTTRYENDQLVVNMTHFSQYIIVRTGLTIEWYVWVLLAVLILSAAAIVVLIILKKRKGAKVADAAEEAPVEETPVEETSAEEVEEELSIEEQIEKAIQEATEV